MYNIRYKTYLSLIFALLAILLAGCPRGGPGRTVAPAPEDFKSNTTITFTGTYEKMDVPSINGNLNFSLSNFSYYFPDDVNTFWAGDWIYVRFDLSFSDGSSLSHLNRTGWDAHVPVSTVGAEDSLYIAINSSGLSFNGLGMTFRSNTAGTFTCVLQAPENYSISGSFVITNL